MGHAVTALLGPREVLTAFAVLEGIGLPVEAQAGVWLLPLTDEVLDQVVGLPVGDPVSGFNYLFPKLLPKLELASHESWLVYAETEYFGGAGAQGAVAIRDGSIVYGPQTADSNCINQALSSVGVQTQAPAHDEFETVGLHLRRRTTDWLAEPPDSDA